MLLKKLSTSERRRVRELVIRELKKYQAYKGIVLTENNHYCQRLEAIVECLPSTERQLVQERYMSLDSDYMTDSQFYNSNFMSPFKFSKIRDSALIRIALDLEIDCGFDLAEKVL